MTTRRLTLMIGMAVAMATVPGPAMAMHAAPAPSVAQMRARSAVADMTQRLLDLAAQRDDAASRRELRRVAGDRRRALAAMIEQDPRGVLAVSLPDEVRRALPPGVRSRIEADVTLDGELEVLHVDEGGNSRFLYAVRTPRGRFALSLAAEPAIEAPTGSRVRVRGKKIGTVLALDGSTASLALVAAALPGTLGAQRTAVLLVNFADQATQPYAVTDARAVVFGSTSNFDLEGSYQQTWLEGDVFGWFTIALSSTVCDYATLASQARAAATNAGVSLGSFTRVVYAFPKNACTWWGLGSIGGNPSSAWINGSLQLAVVAHEMGHNLGLYHSHALECGSTTLGTSCSTVEYGDQVDVMGNASSAHYNAFQKERLGWLAAGASPPITTVTSSGTYAIAPYESVGTAPKALKILKSTDATTGARTWFYVEVRRAVGFDAGLGSNANLMNGVVVHTGSESGGGTSFILDMTPETSSWNDPALLVNRSFFDATSGVTITPRSVGSSGATVDVAVGATSCAALAPGVSLSPAQLVGAPGGSVTYDATIVNNDASGCPASTVTVASVVPSGWTATVASPSVSLAPGASAKTPVTVTAPAGATSGDYPVAVQATEGGQSGTADGVVTIAPGLAVSLFTNRATYSVRMKVTVTVTVAANGSGQSGVPVTVAIKKPDGTIVSQSTTTGTAGTATATFPLRRADPAGVYVVTASAVSGGLAGSGQTTFRVN